MKEPLLNLDVCRRPGDVVVYHDIRGKRHLMLVKSVSRCGVIVYTPWTWYRRAWRWLVAFWRVAL